MLGSRKLVPRELDLWGEPRVKEHLSRSFHYRGSPGWVVDLILFSRPKRREHPFVGVKMMQGALELLLLGVLE